MAGIFPTFMVLARLNDEAEFSQWVSDLLDMCIDSRKNTGMCPDSMFLSEAVKHMRSHLRDNLLREDLAAVACMSPARFSRAIKQTFGMSFSELFASFRVEKAKELLLYTNYSLSEVARESGFNDQSYFTKVFLKFAKITPGQFRRQKQREQQSLLTGAVGARLDADEIK